MPVFNRFRLLSDRELADGAGVNPDAATVATVPLPSFQPTEADPDTAAAAVDDPLQAFPFGDHVPKSAAVIVDPSVPDVAFMLGDNRIAQWGQALAASNVVNSNGTLPAVRGWVDVATLAGPVRSHSPHVILGGAARAAFPGGIDNIMSATVTLEPIGGTTARGEIQIGEFAGDEELPSDAADGLRAWLQTTRSETVILNPANQAQPYVIREAAFASFDASGRAFIAPSDVGIGPGLIDPFTPTANTVERCRIHPTTFLRRVGNVRGVSVVNMRPLGWFGEPITTYQGAPEFYVVNAQPVASAWRFYVDGARVDVNVLHGNLDLRRPRDVWNTLIVPVLTAGASYSDPFIVPTGAPGSTDAIGSPGNPVTPSASLTTLRYLQAARCVGFVFAGNPPEEGFMPRLLQLPAAPRP